MRYIKTDKQHKLHYWRDIEGKKPGTPGFYKLMTNDKPSSYGEAWYILSERVKDLAHSLMIEFKKLNKGRFTKPDQNKLATGGAKALDEPVTIHFKGNGMLALHRGKLTEDSKADLVDLCLQIVGEPIAFDRDPQTGAPIGQQGHVGLGYSTAQAELRAEFKKLLEKE